MRGVPVSVPRPVVPPVAAAPLPAVPVAAADPDPAGHGRPEPLVTVLLCDVLLVLGTAGVVTIGGVPLLLPVLPATDGGCTALGL
jgi:hypothetical protein